MNEITDEIVESQHWGALNAGGGAAPEYLTKLKKDISLVRDIARQYCDLTITDENSKILFVYYFVKVIKDVNKQLPFYIDELQQGRGMEAFCISSGVHRDDAFWQWCDVVCCDMEGQAVYRHLKDCLNKLRELLVEAESVLMHCEPAMFERFFYSQKQCYSYVGVVRRFETWLYDNSYPDIDKLRELQALVVAETLKMGVMDYAKVPSQQEIDEVKLDFLKGLLPYDFEMTANFRVACARWRRYMHWDGYILINNYKKYGKYIQTHFYDFSDRQLQSIFELDVMLKMIHREMLKLMATEQPTENALTENTRTENARTENNATADGETIPSDGGKFVNSIRRLINEGVLKRKYDYTWVMEVANKTDGMPSFNTPKSFVSFLKSRGIDGLPSRETITKKQNAFTGDFPDWVFTDCDANEATRRINVGKRFMTLYRNG